jgi:hypothetical protein
MFIISNPQKMFNAEFFVVVFAKYLISVDSGYFTMLKTTHSFHSYHFILVLYVMNLNRSFILTKYILQ